MSYDNQESKNEVLRSANSREIAVGMSIEEMEATVNRLEIKTRPFMIDQFTDKQEHSYEQGQTVVETAKYQPELSSVDGISRNAKLNAPSTDDMLAAMADKIKL